MLSRLCAFVYTVPSTWNCFPLIPTYLFKVQLKCHLLQEAFFHLSNYLCPFLELLWHCLNDTKGLLVDMFYLPVR